MPPFIKFTEETNTTTGTKRTLRYVNASHILQAAYFDGQDELHIVLTTDPKNTAYRLKGQEAADALEVLKKL